MKKILFLSKGEFSASSRYRAVQFFAGLSRRGCESAHLQISGGLSNYLAALKAAGDAEIVVVLRRVLPQPIRWLLRRRARTLIFDFDDAIFCNSDGSPSKTRMRRFREMVLMSDHVTAGNAFLASVAAQFNDNVTVVPTSVDVTRYKVECEQPTDSFDLVWIGSSSTRKYLADALPGLREAYKALPNMRLKIIADFDLPDAGIPTLAIRWSAETEARELASSHVGIAPMRDNDWTRGKCALKVIQYMAAGLPVIASPAGMNGEIVKNGENGLLAAGLHDWADAIALYARDPALRSQHGGVGQKTAVTNYSIESTLEKLANVFDQVTADLPGHSARRLRKT